MLCESFSGSHWDIGFQMGQRHRFWIDRTLAQFVARHSHEFTDEEMQQLAQKWTGLLDQKSPAHLEQIRGVAEGSGLAMTDLLAMSFRFWNMLSLRRKDFFGASDIGCTNIAFRDPDRGIILGGTLDDMRLPWLLARFAPKGRLRHLCVTWIGTAWGGRGINEAGLAVGASSMPIDGIDYAVDERFEDMAIKCVLERATTTDEAVDLLQSLGRYKGMSVLIADRSGNVRLMETCWSGEQVYNLTRDPCMLSCVNHAKEGPLRRRMVEMGYTDRPSQWSESRAQLLDQFSAGDATMLTFSGMQRLLADHTNYPSSICCTSAVYHTIATPQHGEPGIWVADGPACNGRWEFLPV